MNARTRLFAPGTVKSIGVYLCLIWAAILISGCAPVEQIEVDTHAADVRLLTETMPDDVAPLIADILHNGISNLGDSPYFASCLPHKLNEVSALGSNAGALGLLGIETTAQLEEVLLGDGFREVTSLVDEAVANCAASDGDDTDPYHVFTGNLYRETQYIDDLGLLDISGITDDTLGRFQQYQQCMDELWEKTVNEGCGPVEIQTTSTSDVAETLPTDGTNEDDENGVVGIEIPECPDCEEPYVITVYLFTDEEGSVIEVKKSEEPTINWRAIAEHGLQALITAGITRSWLPLIPALVPIISELIWPSKMPDRPNQTQLCPGPLDARLPQGHPLMGATYKRDGAPFVVKDLYSACNCMFYGDKALFAAGCQDEEQQKLACYLNPYGPDDSIRPECARLLQEDNEVQSTSWCPILCPEPYIQSFDQSCTCGTRQVRPIDLSSVCWAVTCPPDAAPSFDPASGNCGCGSFSETPEFEICRFPPDCIDSEDLDGEDVIDFGRIALLSADHMGELLREQLLIDPHSYVVINPDSPAIIVLDTATPIAPGDDLEIRAENFTVVDANDALSMNPQNFVVIVTDPAFTVRVGETIVLNAGSYSVRIPDKPLFIDP